MNCPQCGQALSNDAARCGYCGSPLGAPESLSVAPAPLPRRRPYATLGCVLFVVLSLAFCNLAVVLSQVGGLVALTLSTVAAVLPAMFYSSLVTLLDRNEREPAMVIVGTFLWGAMVATLFSFVMNTLFGAMAAVAFGERLGDVLTGAISAPLMEESSKGAAVLLLFFYLKDEFDNVLDGIVYGSLVGIGFAMTENVMYFGQAYQRGDLLGLGTSFYLRAILGGLSHAAYTGCTGAGFGYARETNSRFWKVGAPLLGYFFAMVGHSIWNFVGATIIPGIFADDTITYLFLVAPLTGLFLITPAVTTLFVMVIFAWGREARVIREQLSDEAGAGVITMEEYQRLSSIRSRLGTEWRTLIRRGPRSYYRTTQLHQAATDLAFRKWHLSRGERPKRGQKQGTEDYYRRRIMELRVEIQGRQRGPIVAEQSGGKVFDTERTDGRTVRR